MADQVPTFEVGQLVVSRDERGGGKPRLSQVILVLPMKDGQQQYYVRDFPFGGKRVVAESSLSSATKLGERATRLPNRPNHPSQMPSANSKPTKSYDKPTQPISAATTRLTPRLIRQDLEPFDSL